MNKYQIQNKLFNLYSFIDVIKFKLFDSYSPERKRKIQNKK